MRKVEVTPRRALLFSFFVLLVLYSLFQARFLILGPQIKVDTPSDNQLLHANVITIQGLSEHAAYLSLNDRQIFTDEAGHWSEKLILSPGLNIMKLDAKDRFGRTAQKILRVIVN